MRCPAVLFLWIIWVRHRGCFLFQERLGKCVRLGSSGDFADSLAVFAAPKRIGLRSHIRLSGVLVKSSSITSSTHEKPPPDANLRRPASDLNLVRQQHVILMTIDTKKNGEQHPPLT